MLAAPPNVPAKPPVPWLILLFADETTVALPTPLMLISLPVTVPAKPPAECLPARTLTLHTWLFVMLEPVPCIVPTKPPAFSFLVVTVTVLTLQPVTLLDPSI